MQCQFVFFVKFTQDFVDCDLLLVIGTSLQVQPFASLIKRVSQYACAVANFCRFPPIPQEY